MLGRWVTLFTCGGVGERVGAVPFLREFLRGGKWFGWNSLGLIGKFYRATRQNFILITSNLGEKTAGDVGFFLETRVMPGWDFP